MQFSILRCILAFLPFSYSLRIYLLYANISAWFGTKCFILTFSIHSRTRNDNEWRLCLQCYVDYRGTLTPLSTICTRSIQSPKWSLTGQIIFIIAQLTKLAHTLNTRTGLFIIADLQDLDPCHVSSPYFFLHSLQICTDLKKNRNTRGTAKFLGICVIYGGNQRIKHHKLNSLFCLTSN